MDLLANDDVGAESETQAQSLFVLESAPSEPSAQLAGLDCREVLAGRYQVQSSFGIGDVHLAFDLERRELVALKVKRSKVTVLVRF